MLLLWVGSRIQRDGLNDRDVIAVDLCAQERSAPFVAAAEIRKLQPRRPGGFARSRRQGTPLSQPASVFRHFHTINLDGRASKGNEPGPMHTSLIYRGNAVLKAQGIELRWPGFWAFTSASIMAIGLWLLLCGIAVRVDPGLTRADFASLLAVMWLSVAFTRLGLDPRSSWAAAALQFGVCALAALLAQALL